MAPATFRCDRRALSKIKSRRAAFAFALLSAGLAVGAAEGVLGLVSPVYSVGIQQAYQYDPDLGVRLRDGVRLYRITDHQEEIVSNSLGTANPQRDFAGYTRLLFALGDSYTQGTGLPADQSYPMQLDLLLNRDAGGFYRKNYGIVNLGLAAYGGQQSLLALERYARKVGGPAACLYLGSDNDYDDDLLFRNGDRHRHVVYGSPKWGPLAPALIWLGNRQLVLRIKLIIASRRLAALRSKSLGAPAKQPHSATREITDAPAARKFVPRLRNVAELEWPVIEQIVNACRRQGAEVVLAWSALPGTSGSYEWLRAKAAGSSIAFNDWFPRVASVSAAFPALSLTNPHSGGHYRGWVAGKIAEGFVEALALPAEAGTSGR